MLVFVYPLCHPFDIHRYSVTCNPVTGTRREDENVNRLEVFMDSLIEIVVDIPVK